MDTTQNSVKISQQMKGTELKKRPYHSPQLEELANLRDITLGGSAGISLDAGKFDNWIEP